jgi:hypothetical protein
MNSVQRVISENVPETGMARFFSSANLDRFRRLASDGIATAERKRVLQMLNKEWDAFVQECRVTRVIH